MRHEKGMRILLPAIVLIALTLTLNACKPDAEKRQDIALDSLYQSCGGDAGTIDALRGCLHEAGEHRIDFEYAENWKNKDVLFSRLDARVGDQSLPPPAMDCFARTVTFSRLLQRADIESHNIVLISPTDEFSDHVMLEVLNPETGKWELHDPSFDVVLSDAATHAPLSARETVAADMDDIIPCRGEVCGWDLKSWEGRNVTTIRDYLGAMAQRNSSVEPAKVFYVNPARFDIDKPYKVNEKTVTYREFRPGDASALVTLAK